jgi:hypothetical protein
LRPMGPTSISSNWRQGARATSVHVPVELERTHYSSFQWSSLKETLAMRDLHRRRKRKYAKRWRLKCGQTRPLYKFGPLRRVAVAWWRILSVCIAYRDWLNLCLHSCLLFISGSIWAHYYFLYGCIAPRSLLYFICYAWLNMSPHFVKIHVARLRVSLDNCKRNPCSGESQNQTEQSVSTCNSNRSVSKLDPQKFAVNEVS